MAKHWRQSELHRG